MYVEAVTTPHKFRAGTQEQVPLLSAVDPSGIQASLRTSKVMNPEGYDETRLSAVYYIAERVREALHYPIRTKAHNDYSLYGIKHPVQIEALAEHQIAGCHGFTIVASETLEAADIDHYVGYANGHSMLVVADEEQKLHSVDVLIPGLGQALEDPTESVAMYGSSESVNEDIEQYGRGVVILNTEELARRAKGFDADIFETHPWLKVERGNAAADLTRTRELESEPRRTNPHKVFMSVFEQSTGRSVLVNYTNFQQALLAEKYEEAADSLHYMKGLFPDIDARRPHTEIRALLLNAVKLGKLGIARRAIEDYFTSFSISQDSRFQEALGDCLMKLAIHGHNGESAKEATRAYRVAQSRPKSYKTALAGKIRKAELVSNSL